MTEDIQIRMSDKERQLFEKSVTNRSFYLEFGCGGSTILALRRGCRRLISVESDPVWIASLKKNADIANSMNSNRLSFEHVDIGPVGAWGVPVDDSKIRNWPQYFLRPFLKYDYRFDYILIDGRFRNACAYAAHAFATQDTIVAIHDYTVRASYYDIEKFYNIVEYVDTLALLQKKLTILPASLYVSVMTNLFNP